MSAPATTASTRYLLDTNIVLHYVRCSHLARHIEATYSLTLRMTPRDAPLISIVTEAEIRALAVRFRWGIRRLAYLNGFLSRLSIVPVTGADLVNGYVAVDVFSDNIGRPVGSKNDVWIAATAHVTGAVLLTTDRDFDHLDGVFLTRHWIAPATPAATP